MLAAVRGLGIPLPLVPMAAIIGCLVLVNMLTWLRLKQHWPVTDAELFAQLLIDVSALALLLYFSGGSTNPFVSLFLLPLTITAVALPWAYAWAMTAVTALCYSLLLFYYDPLPGASAVHDHMHAGHNDTFGLHVLGMWFNFILSAVLISFFAVRIAASLRERDHLLAIAREETLRNERIIALGTLAAGAAHELGTPLSTMAVIAHELQQEHANDPELSGNLAVLRDQVHNCKRILSELLASAGQSRAESSKRQPVDAFLAELMDRWQLMRPGIAAKTEWQGARPAPEILAEQTLSQAIMNLLNNAADASPQDIQVLGKWDEQALSIEIRDRGPGLTPEAAHNAGKPFFTTKAPGQGIGIGLFLANTTIERFGGAVRLFNREGGGATIQVMLPLQGSA